MGFGLGSLIDIATGFIPGTWDDKLVDTIRGRDRGRGDQRAPQLPCPGPGCPGVSFAGSGPSPGTPGNQVVRHRDPTPMGVTPAERSMGGGGFPSPSLASYSRLVCPEMGPTGARGVLWMQPLSGEVVCLPRGASGAKWGLVRKNKPPTKPWMTGGDVNTVKRAARLLGSMHKMEKKLARDLRKHIPR